MKNNHNGLRTYNSDEVSNLAIGQNGFDIFTGTGVKEAGVGDYADVKYWIGIKAAHGLDAEVTARTMAGVGGDSLGTGGDYDTGAKLKIENGDIIYGVFDKIVASTGDYILCYRG